MAEIIWKWKFRDHGKTNPEDWVLDTILAIDQWEFWDHVKVLPLEWEDVVREMNVFEEKIKLIIENIVNEAIQSYLSYKEENATINGVWIDYETRNLMEETRHIVRDMQIKAFWIQDALDYLGDDVNLDEWYEFEMMGEILSSYREVIFSVLVANEDRIRQRLAAPKRLRRRKNAKKRQKS